MKELKAISAKIKSLRISLNLTQYELGEKAGVGKTYVSKVERELANCTVGTLMKLANALDSSLKELISGDTHDNEVNAFYTKAKLLNKNVDEVSNVIKDMTKTVNELKKDLNKILKTKP